MQVGNRDIGCRIIRLIKIDENTFEKRKIFGYMKLVFRITIGPYHSTQSLKSQSVTLFTLTHIYNIFKKVFY